MVKGLSHLIKAHPASGFKHCFPLAYDKDIRKRTIFARVFACILTSGTKFEPAERGDSVERSPLCEVIGIQICLPSAFNSDDAIAVSETA